MKNLLVLNNITEDQASKYISYINKSGYDLEIITAEGYPDLDRVVFLKQSNQLNTTQVYKYCFYLDDQQELINLPDTFIAPQHQNIMVFNPIDISTVQDFKTSSTKFWYTNSMDFDIVCKFWKSKIHTIDKYFYLQVKQHEKDDNRKYAVHFSYWLNEIIIHPNFI